MTPIERVARAICEASGIRPDDEITFAQPYRAETLGAAFYKKAHEPFQPAWRFFVRHAYAAIEGLREPSEAVCDAVVEALLDRGLDVMVNGSDANLVIGAMIDAALKEAPDAAPADSDPA
jgi:hypothetical protein